MSKVSKLVLFFFLLLLFLIFRNWFTYSSLSAGDWDYQSVEKIKELSLTPFVWDYNLQNGFGGNNAHILGLSYYYDISTLFLSKYLHFPWFLIERIAWFWLFLGLTIAASSYLSWQLFRQSRYILISIFIYLCNTYILLLVSGGQMGVVLAYAIAPFVLGIFMKTVDEISLSTKMLSSQLKFSIVAGLALALQILFDIRIVYLTLIAIGLYVVFNIRHKNILNYILRLLILVIFIPSFIALFLHAFWLLPLIFIRVNPLDQLGAAYNSSEAVKFFSFATFENSLSLLHPNWPENIFGKVSFMRPEFLLLPIVAFSSLLFVSNNKLRRNILFFAFLGLVSSFFAKGANDPFGQIYLWMFNHVPGFIMFRDPTKWYLLTALSYSILIPFSIFSIYDLLKTKHIFSTKIKIFSAPKIFIFLTFCLLLLLIKPVLIGQVGGTFNPIIIPQEYIKLEKFLAEDQSYSRTLWIPVPQRFGYYSSIHPRVSAQNFFQEQKIDTLLKDITNKKTEINLREASIKYILVPYDSQKEIYIEDRKYNEKKHNKIINTLDKVIWLKRINGFGKIAVYEIKQPEDHFWSSNSSAKISYHIINPTEYLVTIINAREGDRLIFTESYDKQWKATIVDADHHELQNNKYGRYNSFIMQGNGTYSVKVSYLPQQLVYKGIVISSLSLITILIVLFMFKLL